MVDDDDEEVADSRTAVNPLLCDTGISSAGNFLLVTGGRLLVGLVCRRRGTLIGVPTPGEWEDMDVGVEVRLKFPGDSDRRVDEPLSWANAEESGGTFGVADDCGGFRVLKVAIRELDVANSELGPIPVCAGIDEDGAVDISGIAIPRTDPGYGSVYISGVLAISLEGLEGASSYEEADDSDGAYLPRESSGALRLRTLRACLPDLGGWVAVIWFIVDIPRPALRL